MTGAYTLRTLSRFCSLASAGRYRCCHSGPRPMRPTWSMLQQRLLDNPAIPFDPCEALVEPLIKEAERFVIEPHQVQDRGMQVRNVATLLDGPKAQLVGRTDRLAPLHASPREPHRKTVPVVVAPRLPHPFAGRCAAE